MDLEAVTHYEPLHMDLHCVQTELFSYLAFSVLAEWLVGCFGYNGPLRQSFSIYLVVS